MLATVESTELPLFENAHQALTFAYEYSNQQFAKSLMAVMMESGLRMPTGKGLGGLDGAAQAGMVKARVKGLNVSEARARQLVTQEVANDEAMRSRLEGYCLVARYARKSKHECPHCGTLTQSAEWREAINYLVHHVAYSEDGVSHLHLRRALVNRYFGEKVDMSETAKNCGVSRVTVAKYWKAMNEKLRKLEANAMVTIDAELQAHGMVTKIS